MSSSACVYIMSNYHETKVLQICKSTRILSDVRPMTQSLIVLSMHVYKFQHYTVTSEDKGLPEYVQK